MTKKCYRFFGGLLTAQANWLNKMAAKGYRLIETKKMLYEFEQCAPEEYQYQIEFVGAKTQEDAENYLAFLQEVGYKVWFKNINLNYSIAKIRWRPWADKGGQIATNLTTYNKELLIVEKKNNCQKFVLHTTVKDKQAYYRSLRKPWLFLFCFILFLTIFFKCGLWE